MDKQIQTTKKKLEIQLNQDYSFVLKIKVGEVTALDLIKQELSSELFQNVIPVYYESKLLPLIQDIEQIRDQIVNSHVQFMHAIEASETIEVLASESIQVIQNSQFQEDVDTSYNNFEDETINSKIVDCISKNIPDAELTAKYLIINDNETFTREINLIKAKVSQIVQEEYQKLPRWMDILADVRSKAYEEMNRDNRNNCRKDLNAYQTMFLKQIQGQYQLDNAKIIELNNLIQQNYNNSTSPPPRTIVIHHGGGRGCHIFNSQQL